MTTLSVVPGKEKVKWSPIPILSLFYPQYSVISIKQWNIFYLNILYKCHAGRELVIYTDKPFLLRSSFVVVTPMEILSIPVCILLALPNISNYYFLLRWVTIVMGHYYLCRIYVILIWRNIIPIVFPLYVLAFKVISLANSAFSNIR